ncbi:hypothetical protein [Tunicatimonas pelagia]|uniref:hypothetical protein n=1 Tax=Tunicatimonas pelagia TaxID=931531 RepID=UPI00266616C9|nr:hypothetical protein [Tunicatimonas pelagia]WKN42971.1 hypothetical protein P0M28_28435 [Tunicatimonas pelagia]
MPWRTDMFNGLSEEGEERCLTSLSGRWNQASAEGALVTAKDSVNVLFGRWYLP